MAMAATQGALGMGSVELFFSRCCSTKRIDECVHTFPSGLLLLQLGCFLSLKSILYFLLSISPGIINKFLEPVFHITSGHLGNVVPLTNLFPIVAKAQNLL